MFQPKNEKKIEFTSKPFSKKPIISFIHQPVNVMRRLESSTCGINAVNLISTVWLL